MIRYIGFQNITADYLLNTAVRGTNSTFGNPVYFLLPISRGQSTFETFLVFFRGTVPCTPPGGKSQADQGPLFSWFQLQSPHNIVRLVHRSTSDVEEKFVSVEATHFHFITGNPAILSDFENLP